MGSAAVAVVWPDAMLMLHERFLAAPSLTFASFLPVCVVALARRLTDPPTAGSYSSTQGSSFLHPTMLLPSVQVPLALQQTTRFVPKPFPDTHGQTGGDAQLQLHLRPLVGVLHFALVLLTGALHSRDSHAPALPVICDCCFPSVSGGSPMSKLDRPYAVDQ